MPTDELRRFLTALGADRIPHAGGSLLDHLTRTSERLASWGASDDVQTIAMAHACYGTDGFADHLLTLDQRDDLRAVVGPEVEAEVYRYASCGRTRTYPHLSDRPDIVFHDRFADTETAIPADDLRPFAALTVANELDVYLHLDDPGETFRTWLLDLTGQLRDLLPTLAWPDCTTALGTPSPCSPAPHDAPTPVLRSPEGVHPRVT